MSGRLNPRQWPFAFVLAGAAGWLAFHGNHRGTSAAAPVKGPPLPTASHPDPVPFTVPAGFVAERIAGPPLVEHPMMGAFDDRGRLFVAESAGLNRNFQDLLKNPPNLIRLLQGTDARGRFLKSTVFADKLTFPMGVLWHRGGLYTTAAPSLWRLDDTKGCGTADRRTALVGKFSSVGNGADIHGPFLGPDGRLYWTKGRHPHDIALPGGKVMKGLGARIFRCRPDGSDLEVVCGGGMDDPVEIAFTPEGEPLATVDILIGRPQRIDGIIYCIEGGVYPHAENVIPEFKLTGDLLPAVCDLGWVAPSGLMRYRGDALGAEYRGNLFTAQFNRHRVQRHVLARDGAAFRTCTEEFLVSANPDFHPTDVFEDPDGSLIVIDTGGWFRIGCPMSQIAKPEIKGAIYRVRRRGAPKVADPLGLALNWDHATPAELTVLLDDPRFAVRDRAIDRLALFPGSTSELKSVLRTGRSARARRNAVWAATRIDTSEARSAVRLGLEDRDLGVRLAAAHAAGLHRDAEALPGLLRLLSGDIPAVRRQAGTALGRLRRPEAVPALFDALRAGGDRFLEHALIYALITIGDRDATLKGLHDASAIIRRAALIALDQMDSGNLTRDLVTPLLNTDDAPLQQAALNVFTRHPSWAKETVGLLGELLHSAPVSNGAKGELPRQSAEVLRGALLAFSKDAHVQELVAQTLARAETPPATRLLLLEVMARASLDRLPASWTAALGASLGHRDEQVVRQAMSTLRTAGITDFDPGLLQLARDSARPAEVRVAALAAVAPRLAHLEPALFALLLGRLDKEVPPLSRMAAAESLGNMRLDEDQLAALTRVVAGAGALELPHLLAAYEHAKAPAVGNKLVAALEKAPGLPGISADVLRRTLHTYPADVQQAAEPILKRLQVDTEKQKVRLAELEPALAGGDSRRGREVFFGTKATCAACHTVQREGGRVGPDLSKIGAIRTGRDLLEAVVFPSASFARGYEPYVVTTKSGRQQAGVITRETADAIYLVSADRAEVRIPRASVDTLDRGTVSVMPQGLEGQLSVQELADLVAFLLSLK